MIFTNPGNIPGQVKRQNFTLGITRPNCNPQERNRGQQRKPSVGFPHPSSKVNIDTPPVEYFNRMITPEFRSKCMTKTTNLRAAMEGAGNPDAGKNYPTFKPFTDQEMDKCIGLLILNGCHPKPQVDQWFLTPQQCPVFGNNIDPHIFCLSI